MKKPTVVICLFVFLAATAQSREIFDAARKDDLQTILNRVVVPEGSQVAIDGKFSKGEWDDALKLSISENYDVCLKVCSGDLFIGLKAAKPVGMLLTEIYLTSNGKEFYNLHSSMALGEGLIPFPADRSKIKFSVNNNIHWEANCCTYNKVEHEKWVAEGEPRDKYDRIFEKKDGKEYKINLIKFSGTPLKMSGVIRDAKGAIHFPDNLGFENSDGWVELVLPSRKK